MRSPDAVLEVRAYHEATPHWPLLAKVEVEHNTVETATMAEAASSVLIKRLFSLLVMTDATY
jgi:hypothetical protein